MKHENTILSIGLPETGKTTFLAAFWHVTRSGEVPDALKVSATPSEREYLNRISGTWRRCLKQIHTPKGTLHPIELQLTNDVLAAHASLLFPDLSGEVLADQWENRHWDQTYDELARRAFAVLLFIHPQRVVEPESIIDEKKLAAALRSPDDDHDGQPETPDYNETEGDGEEVPWTHKLAATQVQLVELLQFLGGIRSRRSPFRTAVVVSAWDKVGTTAPEKWVQNRLNLLWQFLSCGCVTDNVRFFGVSAQGCDYKSPKDEEFSEDQQRMLEFEDASERIRVVCDGEESCDITVPIRWLLDGRWGKAQ